MLKWLVAGKEGEGEDTTITDDPLATLNLKKNKKRNEIYSVNRFNPLFEEEVVTNLDISDSMSDEPETISSGGASCSSGYGSNPTTMGPLNRKEEQKNESQELHVTKTLLNSFAQVETSKKTNHDAKTAENREESEVEHSTATEIPTPVWPELEPNLRGSLPLNSGHVADQIQRLNVILLQEPKITRHRDFVTSISVESEQTEDNVTDLTTTSMGKNNKSDTLSRSKETKPRRNSLGNQVIYQNINPTKQSLILGVIESNQGSNNSSIRKAKNKVKIKKNVNYVKHVDTSTARERVWPGNNRNYTERSNMTRIPAMLTTPEITDRCFGIRHKIMSPIGEDAEKDTRMHDSIVTNSLLMMTSFSPTDSSDSEKQKEVEVVHQDKEDTKTRIDELTRAVIKNKHASTLSRAVTHARRSFRGSKRSLRSSKRRSVRKTKDPRGGSRAGSRAGSLRAGSGVEAVRELWERTGMKTNGRKLLIESEDEGTNDIPKLSNPGHFNKGYESDGSEVSVPRMKGIRKLPETGHRNSGSQSSTTSYDSVPRSRPRLVRNISDDSGDMKWEVHGIARMNGLDVVDLDTIHMENDSDNSSKHVRFSSRTRYTPANSKFQSDHLTNSLSSRLVSRIGVGELDRGKQSHGMWERYYGSTDPSRMEAGLGPSRIQRNCDQRKSTSTLSSDLTMDHIKSGLLRKKEKKRKKLRCFCKMFCFLLLLSSFLLVIVAVSIFLTKGKNYFGAL